MSKHLIVVDYIQSPNGGNIAIKNIGTYQEFLTNDDFDSDDIPNKRAVLDLIANTPSPSTAIAHQFDITAGVDDTPFNISVLDFPDYGPNSFFEYEVLVGGNWRRFFDFTVDVLETSGIFTGFDFYGHDDGTGKFAEDARIKMISGPASSTGSGTSVIDILLASANTWSEIQTFAKDREFLKGAFKITETEETLTANRVQTRQDKSGTQALLGDLPTTLKLSAAGDGLSLIVSLAHGLSGVTSSWKCHVTVNSEDAGPYSEIVYFDCDATYVNIYYDVARPIPVSGNNLAYTVDLKP